MRLALERPLVCFDLETTGLDVANDRIVEISCVKVFPDGRREVRTRRLNPGRPISAEASQVHGISDADVEKEPRFEKVAKSLHTFLVDCDLSGFNLEQFDLPILSREFDRAGLAFPQSGTRVIDSRKIYMQKEPRNLAAALRLYCNRDLQDAHSAEADAIAAADILLAQGERYADLPGNIEDLHDFCHPQHPDWLDADGRLVWRGGEVAVGFGKHKHRSLRELAQDNPDYLRWIATSDFSPEVVAVVRGALEGVFPTPPPGNEGETS